MASLFDLVVLLGALSKTTELGADAMQPQDENKIRFLILDPITNRIRTHNLEKKGPDSSNPIFFRLKRIISYYTL